MFSLYFLDSEMTVNDLPVYTTLAPYPLLSAHRDNCAAVRK